ncbi:MAG: hypothetical protein JOS17DRAFT_732107 [Linnemannia elongata]|nr:MAG: hypothetical protein JOS17DRAFT_732107 [Linnemannia elongata]
MKSLTIVALSALALASQVCAQFLSYSEPISSTQWTAGKSATVSWSNTCNDSSPNTISLHRQVGDHSFYYTGIGTMNCSVPGSTQVQIPATAPQSSTYFIWVIAGDFTSTSALFTILSTVSLPSTSAPFPLPTNSNMPTGTAPENAKGSSVGAIAGGIAGGIAGALVFVAAVSGFVCFRRRRTTESSSALPRVLRSRHQGCECKPSKRRRTTNVQEPPMETRKSRTYCLGDGGLTATSIDIITTHNSYSVR